MLKKMLLNPRSPLDIDLYAHPHLYSRTIDVQEIVAECDALEFLSTKYGRIIEGSPKLHEAFAGPAHRAIAMASRGWKSTASDASPQMMGYAIAVADAVDVELAYAISVAGDVVGFNIADSFDVVWAANNSVSHLLEAEQVAMFLKQSHDILAPGGLLVFDVTHPEHLIGRAEDEPVHVESEDDNGRYESFVVIEDHDPLTGRYTMRADVFDWADDDCVPYTATYPLRAYSLDHWLQMIEQAGFVACWTYGNMSLPLMPLKSGEGQEDMVFVCMKQEPKAETAIAIAEPAKAKGKKK